MNLPIALRSLLANPQRDNSRVARFPDKKPEAGHESRAPLGLSAGDVEGFADQELFNCMLRRERKRTERTSDPFVLALINLVELQDRIHPRKIDLVCGAVQSGIRDTDFAGWYRSGAVIGIIYTALGGPARDEIASALREKIEAMMASALDAHEIQDVVLSFHFFPEDSGRKKTSFESDETLYPDIVRKAKGGSVNSVAKRMIDIAGSLGAFILFLPCFLVIPLLIKLTSRGPVFFRQRRIGQFGKEFAFLKFRSMYVNNDSTIHQQYIQKLIDHGGRKPSAGVCKITNDPRITPIGRFIRKTSLDELPQFLNVLKGEMSIVGPRPPIPYEVSSYRFWHRRRVVEVKPGITGLWQVEGRSRTSFDDMVRLDLQYIKKQSVLLDLKIILKTPRAVISGAGAY